MEAGTVQSRIFRISVLSRICYEMNCIGNNDHITNITDKVIAVLQLRRKHLASRIRYSGYCARSREQDFPRVHHFVMISVKHQFVTGKLIPRLYGAPS